jgi:hypothetical protein
LRRSAGSVSSSGGSRHSSAKSTEIYAKVAVEQLRQVALGDGEEVLS